MRQEKNDHQTSIATVSLALVGIIASFFILYVAQEILIPLVFSLIIAILLNPLVNRMHRFGFSRVLSITIAVFLLFMITAGLAYFIGAQMSHFSEAFPMLKERVGDLIADCTRWISKTFHVSNWKVKRWLNEQQNEGINNSPQVIGATLNTLSGILVAVFLIPVYVFLFLFYKPLLLDFIARNVHTGNHKSVVEVLNESKVLIQKYLIGLLIEAVVVAALNAGGLLLLGIQYALLLGVIGALLNIVPYIGGIIGTAIPMLLALATKEPVYALYVAGWYMLVQFIDNNLIVPQIVASKVKINALVSVVAVLAGGAMWGVSGMFLSLPVVALCKVVFDRVESLKPLGMLLGDSLPPIGHRIWHFSSRAERRKSEKE